MDIKVNQEAALSLLKRRGRPAESENISWDLALYGEIRVGTGGPTIAFFLVCDKENGDVKTLQARQEDGTGTRFLYREPGCPIPSPLTDEEEKWVFGLL